MRLVIVFLAILTLAGCNASNLPREASYTAQMNGQFDEAGEFAANLAIVANYADDTFSGILQDFRFSRPGFERPAGSVPISGTIARTPEGEVLLQGTGDGVLSQGELEYALAVEMESSYVDPEAETISIWYFGGGDFTEAGVFLDWPSLAGDLQAESVCKRYFSSGPCVIPSVDTVAQSEPDS